MTLIDRAMELDDHQPDNVCPGCGQDITGWDEWWCHYSAGVTLEWPSVRLRRIPEVPWPFIQRNTGDHPVCPWDRDMLTARRMRRRLIRTGSLT